MLNPKYLIRSQEVIPPSILPPVTIIGVGAIGSHLAPILYKLGVPSMVLIDPDTVNPENIGIQGFSPSQLGENKAVAVRDSLSREGDIVAITQRFNRQYPPSKSVWFACVDTMRVRAAIYRQWEKSDSPLLLDTRVASESMRIFLVSRGEGEGARYQDTLFPDSESLQEGCTQRGTIYTATLCAGLVAYLLASHCKGGNPPREMVWNIPQFDLFKGVLV